MVTPSYFPEIIGQEKTIRKLSFLIEGQRANGFCPPVLFVAKRGDGKTSLARALGRNLVARDGTPKKFVEVNGASLKTVSAFVNNIIIPHVNNAEVTLCVDETHSHDNRVRDWILSMLARNKDKTSMATHDGAEIWFNWTQFSFIAATTNPEKLSEAFKNRLERIDLEPYKAEHLVAILLKNTPDITYDENIEHNIVSVVRDSPRQTVHLAEHINQFSAQTKNTRFNKAAWQDLSKKLDIKPFGLTHTELALLRHLNECGGLTLTSLSAKLSLDATTIRRDIESFLLSRNLIQIDGKRFITGRGKEMLKIAS